MRPNRQKVSGNLLRMYIIIHYLVNFSVSIEKITLMQKFELLTSIRLLIDLVHAVNTLPPGFLWSSKLQTWHVGLIGSLSSVLGIYQVYYRRSIK